MSEKNPICIKKTFQIAKGYLNSNSVLKAKTIFYASCPQKMYIKNQQDKRIINHQVVFLSLVNK